VTRLLPSFMFGLNPDSKIAESSYNTTQARKFNRDIQRNIESSNFSDVFPDTKLKGGELTSLYVKNSDEFDVVDHKGGLKAVGRGGALTGNTVDIMIMDDLYKDYMEGSSPLIRENVWDWYTSVVDTRLHNDSQQLIVFTRWNEDDLIGRLEKKDKVFEVKSWGDIEKYKDQGWVKINFQAIKEDEKTELDPREQGEPLWPNRHSKEKLEKTRSLDPSKFDSLHQGNPTPKEGFLYNEFNTYNILPSNKTRRNITDTADTGSDFLCSMCYIEHENKAYITDVLFSDEPMEETEPATAKMLEANKVQRSRIESNNGGRGFARAVDRLTNASVAIEWFHQSGNKESRVTSNSASVNRNIIFPIDWKTRWPVFYNHVKMFKRNFKANKHDDAPDCMTLIIEDMAVGEGSGQTTSNKHIW